MAKEWRLDNSIISSIEVWFKYGLPPGLFTEKLLQLDNTAINHAHELIIPHIDDHEQFVLGCIPCMILGEFYNTWKGYEYCTKEDRIVLRLATQSAIICKWMSEIDNNKLKG